MSEKHRYTYSIIIKKDDFKKYFDVTDNLSNGFLEYKYIELLGEYTDDYQIILYFPKFGGMITNSKYGWDSYEVAAEDPYQIEIEIYTYDKKDLAKLKLML